MDIILFGMYKFQKDRDIKNQCVTNTQFLYDNIKNSYNVKVKARACLVISMNTEIHEHRTIAHLVLYVNDKMLDPSYEIAFLKSKEYCFDIKTYMQATRENNISPDFYKSVIGSFIEFLNLADRMNAGELLVCDKSFYHEQANFIEAMAPGNPGM